MFYPQLLVRYSRTILVIIVILTLGLLLSTRLDLGSTTAGLVTRNQTKTSGGLVTRSQPRAGVDKAWSKLQDQRRARVAEVCAKYGKKTRVPEHYDRFFFAPSYNLMMCATAKAGSTTYMLTTFNQILEGDDFRPVVEPDGGRSMALVTYHSLKSESNLPKNACVQAKHL